MAREKHSQRYAEEIRVRGEKHFSENLSVFCVPLRVYFPLTNEKAPLTRGLLVQFVKA